MDAISFVLGAGIGSAATIVLAAKLLMPGLAKKVDRNNSDCLIAVGGKCAYPLFLEGEECTDTVLAGGKLLDLLLRKSVCGYVATLERVALDKAVKRLESKILTYQVLMERSPSESLRKKVEQLKRVVRDIARYRDPVRVKLALLVCDAADRSLFDELRLLGCTTRKINLNLPLNTNFLSLNKFYAISLRSIKALHAIAMVSNEAEGPIIGCTIPHCLPVTLPLYDFRGARHSIIVGPTGKGKTTLLAKIVTNSLLSSDILGIRLIAIVDPKGDLVRLLEGYGIIDEARVHEAFLRGHHEVLKTPISSSAVILADSIDSIYNVVRWEAKELWKYGFEKARSSGPLRTLVVVDEAWRAERSLIESIVREGRSRALALVAASQHPMDFSTFVWSNASNYIAFGSTDENYVNALERYTNLEKEDLSLAESLTVGEALLGAVDIQPPIVFRIA
ncbi:MAG: hypothetical protein ABWW70_06735 [Thermoproteota archaeon]